MFCLSKYPLLILALVVSLSWANESKVDNGGDSECSEEELKVDSEVRVASLRLEEVRVPLILSAFILIVILVKIGWHHPMMQDIAKWVPESIVLITIGTFVGGILVSSFLLDKCNRDDSFPVRFTPEIFFIYLLPPIIFASGYFMDIGAFFQNFVTIIIFALIGTIWNAFALGFTIFGLSRANLMSSNFNLPSSLLYGTISSAVDPVAVLAVFDEIHVNKQLHILVFGESLLNDAVTVVLFEVLGSFANIPFDMETEHDIGDDVILGIVQFVVVVVASVLIGLLFGCIGVLLTRVTHHVHVLEPILLYVVGFVSYLMADLFAFSGIVSLITCSIIMKHYVPANIAWKSNITFKYTLKMLSIITEMIIFMFLGISLYDADVHKWDTGLVLWTLFFTLIFRPIGVVALSLLVNLNRFHKIGLKEMFIMSYSGLRGAVAFALALTRVFEHGFKSLPQEEQELRKSMLTATTVLVMFTVFVQGSTIKPLVQWIGVKLASQKSITMNKVIHKTAIDHISTGLYDISGHLGFNQIKDFFLYIDVNFLRKIFERHTEGVDEDIIRKFQDIKLKETRSQLFEINEDSEALVNRKTTDTPSVTPSLGGEDFVPTLDEVLRLSYIHPHDSHYMHILSRDHHEIEDHHLERFKVQRRIQKRNKKPRKYLRRQSTLGMGYFSEKLDEIETSNVTDGGEGGTAHNDHTPLSPPTAAADGTESTSF